MAKVIRSTKKRQGTAATTHTALLPDNQEDDVIFVWASQRGNISASAFTVTSGWTIQSQDDYGTVGRSILLYKVAGSGGESTAPTVTSSVSESWVSITTIVRGADTADLIEATTTWKEESFFSGGEHTVNTTTTSETDCLVLTFCGNYGLAGEGSVPEPKYGANFNKIESVRSDSATNSTAAGAGWSWMASSGTTPANVFVVHSPSGNAAYNHSYTIAVNDDGNGYNPPRPDKDTEPAEHLEWCGGNLHPISGAPRRFLTADMSTIKTGSNPSGITTYNHNSLTTDFTSYTQDGAGLYCGINHSGSTGFTSINIKPSSTVDLTTGSGLLYGVFRMSNLASAFNLQNQESGGVIMLLYDNQEPEEYIMWQVGAKDSNRDLSYWTPYLIQVDDSAGTAYHTELTPDLTNIESFGLGLESTISTAYLWMDFYMLLNKLRLAGGSSSFPVTTEDVWSVIAHGGLPYGEKVGESAFLSYIPIVVGGGEAIYADIDGMSLQFPKNYDEASKQLNIHVADNKLGLTLDGNSGDTIKIRNSLISGASKWHFIMESALAGTYDLSGTTISNAGTVTLRDISQDLSGMTFSECDTIALNGCDLVDSTITASTADVALDIASTTECADLSNLTFTDNNQLTTSHSIEFNGTAGTYAADNFQFTNTKGRTAFGFHTNTAVDGTNDEVDETAHGYSTGDPVYYQKHSGTDSMGLTNSTLYYVNAQTANSLSFHTTEAAAIAGTGKVNLTASGGSETHWIYSANADCFNNTTGNITYSVTNGGDTPTFRNAEAAGAGTTGFNVQNSVTVTVTVQDEDGAAIQNARVLLEESSGGADVLTGLTNASGVATTSYSGSYPVAVTGWVRKGSSSPYYKQATLSGSITTSGYDVTVTLVSDE